MTRRSDKWARLPGATDHPSVLTTPPRYCLPTRAGVSRQTPQAAALDEKRKPRSARGALVQAHGGPVARERRVVRSVRL